MPRLTPVHRSLFATAAALFVLTGCSRQAFRERADRDVEAVISQKNVVPQWQVQNWHVYPDSRARFSDPNSPDFPSYPPDDYAAKVLSPNPQRPGKGGSGRHEGDGWLTNLQQWDAANRAEDTANGIEDGPNTAKTAPAATPSTPSVTGATDDDRERFDTALQIETRGYRLRMDQAVELGLYNSREFQDRREDLYLAALPVTLQRFSFAAQAVAASEAILNVAGQQTATPGDTLNVNSTIGMNRRFSTGAELLVRLANQVVVDLSGPRPTISTSTLGLTLAVPFLRGGGFAVTLEPLALAERNLLYAIRSYARFRSVFYVSITAAGDYTNNPYGLQGLAQNLGRGIGANLTANPVGYLPTILRSAILNNERGNLASFDYYLRLFRSLEEGGIVTKLQVGRIEQQLLSSRATVLQRSQEYLDNIDNFKLQLGMPATVPLELDETPLRPIRNHLKKIEAVYAQLREVEEAAVKLDPDAPAGAYREAWTRLLTESAIARGTRLSKEYPEWVAGQKGKTDEQLEGLLDGLRVRRRKVLEERDRKLQARQPAEAETVELEKLDTDSDRLRFELALRRAERREWAKEPDAERKKVTKALVIREVLNFGSLVVVPARNEKLAALRDEWAPVPAIVIDDVDVVRAPLETGLEKVATMALNNRFDLMNARAQVVDAWRQVAVTANALQGAFDVEYDLALNSPAGTGQTFALGGSRTLNQIRLRLEPPFVRRAERNNYRAALVAFQRQRRNLMAFEDNIATDVRSELRQVRQLEQTLVVQQRAVELAYQQVDNARGTLLAPPDPRVDVSAAAAAQTEQLLQVQGALVRAQNDLFTTWVRYLTARMNLFLDLELLTLDARGLWCDEQPPPAPAAPAPPADRWRPAVGEGGPVPGPALPGPAAPAAAGAGAERLPEPLPVLSHPDPEAAPRGRAVGADRPDPFPPIKLPAADGQAGER
jgi:outer membrane protein TolC